jgi:hypothetical protein
MAADDGSAPERAAFYALEPGGWRDWWSLLHPPYTLWHLSYVVLGAAVATHLDTRWLLETIAGFFLAMGIGAHALDELNGRPLRTTIGSKTLIAAAILGIAAAIALGIDGMIEVSPWLAVFIAFGAFVVPAYNLELFGGLFHSDLWFALAWGAFPALTGAFAQMGSLKWAALAVAAFCAVVSAAQRTLSTPVRKMRRRVTQVEGTVTLSDGGRETVDRATMIAAPERALRLLSIAMPVLALAALLARA